MNKKFILTAIGIIILLLNNNNICAAIYLNISIYDESEFFIEFDNVMMNTPGNYAEFDSIQGSEHNIKIFKSNSGIIGEIIYSGKVKIPIEKAVWYVIDEYGSMVLYKKLPYVNKEIFIFNNSGRKKCGSDKNIIISYPDDCTNKIIKEDDFKDLKKSISNRNFEVTNVDILKEALDKNIFLAEQIRALLSFFTFEYNKLEIAKYAYKHTCDKKNYFKVFDAFYFDSSVNELKEYIKNN